MKLKCCEFAWKQDEKCRASFFSVNESSQQRRNAMERTMRVNVLIADQDVELARLYCQYLAGKGCLADLASSRLECLKKLREQVPNVLILDRELPHRAADGVLASLRMEDLPPPVILTTWSTSPKTLNGLVVSPVVLCLRKFFPLPSLLAGIHHAVNHCECRSAFADNDTFGGKSSTRKRVQKC